MAAGRGGREVAPGGGGRSTSTPGPCKVAAARWVWVWWWVRGECWTDVPETWRRYVQERGRGVRTLRCQDLGLLPVSNVTPFRMRGEAGRGEERACWCECQRVGSSGNLMMCASK